MLAPNPALQGDEADARPRPAGIWRLSLRGRLVALVVAAVLPVLLFSAALVLRLSQSESAAIQESLRQATRAMSLAVDREIGAAQAVLGVLAASPALAAGDYATFRREAAVAAGVRGSAIVLADRGGRQLANTGRPADQEGPALNAVIPGLFEAVLATGGFQVSDVFTGTLSGEPRVLAALPIRGAGGEIAYVLGMTIPSARLKDLLVEQGLRPTWIGSVLDRNGLVVARTVDAPPGIGQSGGSGLQNAVVARRAEGYVETEAGGEPIVTMFARSGTTGWTVAVGMPRAEANARLRDSLLVLAGAGAALLALAVIFAVLVGRSIATPIAALAASARALGSGEPLAGRTAPEAPELAAVDESLRGAQLTIRSREAELRAATARAEALAAERAAVLGQLVEGVIVTDATGRITFVNEAASRLHGVARLDATLDAYASIDRVLTEDGRPHPPQDLPLARAVLAGETVIDARWRIRRPDGVEVLAIGSASPLLDTEGRRIGAVLTVRDDTARDEAERLLRERERELARVQRIGRVGGLEVDLRGHAFRNRRSPEYLRIHGLRPEDAFETHENWVARIHPEDREEVVAHFQAAVDGTGSDYEAEYRIVRPSDGAERWILAKAEIERAPDGLPLRLVGAHIDITKRKRAELALEARTRELESVLATVPAAVWFTHDPQVRQVRRNDYAAHLMQVDPTVDGSLGRRGDELRHVRVLKDGRDATPDELPLQRAMRGLPSSDEEFAFRFPDGTERALLSSATALRDDGGRVVGAVSVALDITERKRAERHQRLLIHELNHRVKNTLATVQSIAAQTFKSDAASAAAREAFESRLMALSRAHDVLTRESWEGAALREIVEGAVSAHDGASFRIEGPDLRVSPRVALALAMSLHELCTNAAKYGALSVPGGSVSILWAVAGDERSGRLAFRWEERGGPPVVAPLRRGFGSRLIERQLAAEFDGAVRLDFRATGVVCTIDARLETDEEAGPSVLAPVEPRLGAAE